MALKTGAAAGPSISTRPSRPTQSPAACPAQLQQRPAYLPVGLAGDSIGVTQNLQLHVRLKDPALERKTKWQVSDGGWPDPSHPR